MIAVVGGIKTIVRMQMKLGGEPGFDDDMMAGGMAAGQPMGANPDLSNIPGLAGMPDLSDMPGSTPSVYAKPERTPVGADPIEVRNCGCGFQIAKRLAEQGREVAMISVAGTDPMGPAAIETLKSAGIDIRGVSRIEGLTPIDVETVNVLGDVEMKQSNDLLLNSLTPELVEKHIGILDAAEAIVLDGALPVETLKMIGTRYGKREDVKLFFDPAGLRGAGKGRVILEDLYCLMPGRMEAEALTGLTILSEEQLNAAGTYFAEKGIARVIITMKGGGIYYREGLQEGILRPERVLSFLNTSGAGDVVSAAVIAELTAGKSVEEAAQEAMCQAAAYLAEREAVKRGA